MCDKAFVPLTGVSCQTLPLVGGFSTLEPSDAHRSTASIWAKIGVKTGKTRKEFFTALPARCLLQQFALWLVMDSRSLRVRRTEPGAIPAHLFASCVSLNSAERMGVQFRGMLAPANRPKGTRQRFAVR